MGFDALGMFDLDEAPPGLRAGLGEINAGDYEIPTLTFEGLGRPPVILDIGGHVGHAAWWFGKRWPGAKIIAYEPHPVNARLFREHCPGVELHEVAVINSGPESVTPAPATVTLYDGNNELGEASGQASLECRGGNRRGQTFTVRALHARELPPADMLKLDTEGNELPIIFGYSHWDTVGAVALEYHHRDDLFYIGTVLIERGLRCVGHQVANPHDPVGRYHGLLKFVRPSFRTQCELCRLPDGRRTGFQRADGLFECIECEEVFR